MATSSNRQLEPALESVLARLRRRIRAYVWAEGLSIAVVLLGVCFWTSLGFDWVFEPPAALRAGVLALAAGGLAYVLFRYIYRRAFVHLADRSLAVLLERRFSNFHDSLLTSVELAELPDHARQFNSAMLQHTHAEAVAGVARLPLGKVFNSWPLARRILMALLCTVSVVLFGIWAGDAFGVWTRRVLLLENELWPRETRLLVEGFEDGQVKLARGSDLKLVVKADAGRGWRLPAEGVQVRYTTSDGMRGRENMTREGVASTGDDFQTYTHLFKGVLTEIEFYVLGGDDRQGPLKIEVVDSPTASQMLLRCEFPPYMHRSPRDIPVTGLMQLPRGAKITIEAQSNKDLVQVQIDRLVNEKTPVTEKVAIHSADARRFAYTLDRLDSDTTLLFTLLDTDGIRNREPVRLSLSALADEPPQVAVHLKGIGSAITPAANLPSVGEITDDYGVARAWFDYHVDDEPAKQVDFKTAAKDRHKLTVSEVLDAAPLGLKPKQKLHFSVQAADSYALAAAPNVGASQRYVLDVVTPEQLRALLEARELILRRRFETIFQELNETRDALSALSVSGKKPSAPAVVKDKLPKRAPDDKDSTETEQGDGESANAAQPPKSPEEQLATLQVHVERVLQNSQRSAHEVLGVATAFDEIREELINNRVDTAELKSRLKQGIADPLRLISEQMFPEFDLRVKRLKSRLASRNTAGESQSLAVAQADAILVEMKQVLDRMIELETFNQIVDLLRGIITSQEQITDATKTKQKEKLRDLIDE